LKSLVVNEYVYHCRNYPNSDDVSDIFWTYPNGINQTERKKCNLNVKNLSKFAPTSSVVVGNIENPMESYKTLNTSTNIKKTIIKRIMEKYFKL
jgi:hypothetical protein